VRPKKTPLSRLLHEYIRDRAVVEGVAYEFTPAFFQSALNMGVAEFFGVEVEDGKMISDTQEPKTGYFKQWIEKRIP